MKKLSILVAIFFVNFCKAQVYESFEYRPFNLPPSDYISSYALCDFNDDDLFDVVLAHQTETGLSIKIKLNEGDTNQLSLGKIDSLTEYSNIITSIKNPAHIATSDIDGDGDQDIYICEVGGFGISSAINVYENTTTNNVISFVKRDIPSIANEFVQSIPSVMDFDEDGIDDIVISNFDGRNSFYKNNQDFTFTLVGANLLGLNNYVSPLSCAMVPTVDGDSSIFAFNFEKDFHLYDSQKTNGAYPLSDKEFMANPDTLQAKFFQISVEDFNYDGLSDVFLSSLTYTIQKGYFTQTWLLKGADACEFALQLSTTDVNGEYFEASSNIKSNAVISSPNKVDFSAGKYVILEPGFSANRGAVFKALIEGCRNN